MRRLSLLVLFLLLLAACDGGGSGASTFRAGAGSSVLPIPVGHPHAGYLQSEVLGAPQPQDDPGSPFADIFPATRSLQSAPKARAVVLEHRGRQVVLAQLDAIFVTAALTHRVQELARKRLGVDLGGRLLLHATHTHGGAGRFAPESLRPTLLAAEPEAQRHALAHGLDTFSPESTDRIAGGVVEAIGAAFATLRPARFGWAQGENGAASRDRRCHDDWITGAGDRDERVTVLRIDDAQDGGPIAVLFHFALHGILYDHDSRHLSVDAPGFATYAVERGFAEPVVAIFLQGAAAAASPDGMGLRGSQAMQRVGQELAGTVLELHDSIEPGEPQRLAFASRRVPIDAARLGYRDGEFPAHGAMLCHFLDSSCTGAARDPAAIDCLGRAEAGGGKYETWMAALQLGDLTLLTLPGEPSAALGRALEAAARRAGFEEVLTLGYSLDHDGYILLADDWLSGGSETNITFWGWRHGDYAVEQSLETLQLLDRHLQASEAVQQAETPSYAYEPVAPTASEPAPAVIEEPPEVVERLEEIGFAFHGGDPALGTPEVVLQRRVGAAWETVRESGWIPVSNLHGWQLPTFYEATPSHREAPAAAARAHRWRVLYEPPRDLDTGIYRLQASGEALVAGAAAPFSLPSAPFEVEPSRALHVEAAIAGDRVAATLLYPVRAPTWGEGRNDGWQLGGFRAVDPRFLPDFVPVLDGAAAAGSQWTFSAGELEPGVFAYAPGDGPGFHLPLPQEGGEVVIPAGTLRDRWGNHHGEELRLPAE